MVVLTIVVKAMGDLMANDHADATIVKGPRLAFTKEGRLKNASRKHWETKKKMFYQQILKKSLVSERLSIKF